MGFGANGLGIEKCLPPTRPNDVGCAGTLVTHAFAEPRRLSCELTPREAKGCGNNSTSVT